MDNTFFTSRRLYPRIILQFGEDKKKLKIPEIQRIIYYFINMKITEKVAILPTFFSGEKAVLVRDITE